ncbi:MAG: SLC13 family permease [Candidatus Glassbacteria bacterium]
MKPHTTFVLVLSAALIGAVLALSGLVSLPEVLAGIPWGILVIFVSLDIFTQLIVRTGIMEVLAIRLLRFSHGRKVAVLFLFGILLFAVSSLLNNLTAVMVILPVTFLILGGMRLNRGFVAALFALILAASNIGGAATPIGDFPAILIMTSGLTTFHDYLFQAWPLFAVTMLAVIAFHVLNHRLVNRWKIRSKNREERERRVEELIEHYKEQSVDRPLFRRLAIIFAAMFVAWIVFPATRVPPEIPALVGLALGIIFTHRLRGVDSLGGYVLTPVFAIGSFLFIASLAANTGILEWTAAALRDNIAEPRSLLLAVMALTAVLTGIFSAGPTAAAMLPVLQAVSGPGSALAGFRSELAVAFAASICAGSSLFVWSATAGFVLLDKFKLADLRDRQGTSLACGVSTYLRYGVIHFIIQLGLGIAWALMFIPL